jgi:hypothetical protein
MKARARPGRLVVVVGVCYVLSASPSRADEGGVSFWLPGQMGSFAAVGTEPGWSVPVMYFHDSASANGSKNFIIGGQLTAGVSATADLAFMLPGYTFKDPVLGGQAAFSVGWAVGTYKATASVAVTDAQGNTVFRSRTDKLTGGSDLYPLGTLKWNDGTSNWMVYGMGDIPVGAYSVGRLANIGINHAAIDGGGGYTYFDPKKGHEASIVGGFTYNWENSDTRYQNGVDSHIDWAVSQFLNEQLYVGVAGYGYWQLTGDRGDGAILGANKGRIYGIGPEAGYFFPFGGSKGVVSLRVNWDFGAQNRAAGWNAFVSLLLPLESAPK